jgi:prophage regulatory protein
MSMKRTHPAAAATPQLADGSNAAIDDAAPPHRHVEQLQGALRILRLKQLIERTGLSRSTIFEKLNPRSRAYDAEFPKKLYLNHLSGPDGDSRSGHRRGSAIGFLENELNAWIAARAADRTGKLGG